MENITIDHLAVLVCALAILTLGALWCLPFLFHKARRRDTGSSGGQGGIF